MFARPPLQPPTMYFSPLLPLPLAAARIPSRHYEATGTRTALQVSPRSIGQRASLVCPVQPLVRSVGQIESRRLKVIDSQFAQACQVLKPISAKTLERWL